MRARVRTQIQWIGRNVLSVKHYTWHPEFMELEHVDEVELPDALRGEVELQRVKRHYYERNYKYEYSVTPEHADVARRAKHVCAELMPLVEQGYTIVSLTPSCTHMLKSEWPLLLAHDSSIQQLSAATIPWQVMETLKYLEDAPASPV